MAPRSFNTAILLLVSVTLCACSQPATRPTEATSTNFKPFIPPNAQQLHPKLNQKVVLGEPISQAPPSYPLQMIKKDIPQRTVCLSIAIDNTGAVFQSTPLYNMSTCPVNAQAAAEPAFVEAAQAAVQHWRFNPTLLCTFPDGVDASNLSDYCLVEGAKEVSPIPIRLAFIFIFTQHHGVTKVKSDQMVK